MNQLIENRSLAVVACWMALPAFQVAENGRCGSFIAVKPKRTDRVMVSSGLDQAYLSVFMNRALC